MRKDAQRNRERLVEAAREVFAQRGLDAPLEEISRRAGVSIGTLYNRFPARADLVEAAFADRVDAVRAISEAALAMDDPWEGFVAFVERVSVLQAADRGFNELAVRRRPEDYERGYRLMSGIVERAKESGALRDDFVLADMAFVMWSIARTIEMTGEISQDAWRRHLALTLDGLRAQAARPLPVPPLTDDEVTRAVGAC
ncbi:MAG: TetR/AcrR family transcriptional regulator [Nonomuraea sp.]|nr:TetR/AcrR family transcriptional regulator [Nonomuraea sp.]